MKTHLPIAIALCFALAAGCADDDTTDINNGQNTPQRDAGANIDLGQDSSDDDMAADLSVDSSKDATHDLRDLDGPSDLGPDATPDMDAADMSDVADMADMADMMALPVEHPNELITDRHFKRGFTALAPPQGQIVPVGTLAPGFQAGAPVWQLGQWGSKTSLHSATPVTLPSGAIRWADTYGAVTIGPVGTTDADLALRVNAYEEYGGVYRAVNATVTWPHLLAEQRLSPPDNPGPDCPRLSELSALDFSMDARLLFHVQNKGPGYDSSRHAADYLIFFTIQNLNMSSPGYGDFLWFGIHPYADRPNTAEPYIAGDDFSQKLIYNIGRTPLSAASLDDKQWHAFRKDILPDIKAALQEAWRRGYMLGSQNVADYAVGGMNMGWEIPGLNNAEVQVRNLSLIYTRITPNTAGARWDFNTDGDREGWTFANTTELNGGPLSGYWVLSVPGQDPALTSPNISVDTATNKKIVVTMANSNNPVAGSNMQVFWSTTTSPGFSESKSAIMAVSNGGGYSAYTFDLSAHPEWTGTITQLRVDPIQYGNGNGIGIDSVAIAP